MGFFQEKFDPSFHPPVNRILNNGYIPFPANGKDHGTLYADWGLEYADLALRIKTNKYHFRHELLLDVAAHLVWCSNAITGVYDYQIIDWRSDQVRRQDVYLAAPSSETNHVQADFIARCYENLRRGDNPEVEEAVFDTLFQIVEHRPRHKRLNFLPRVSDIATSSTVMCVAFPESFLPELPFSEEDIDSCQHPESRLQALLRLSMIASNAYYWLRYQQKITAVCNIKAGQGVLVCRPCVGQPMKPGIRLAR